MPFTPFDHFKSFKSLKEEFTVRFEYNKTSKEEPLSDKMFIKREIIRTERGLEKFSNNLRVHDMLLSYLAWLEDKKEIIFNEKVNEKDKNAATIKESGKLSWNGDKHLLTHIFYILRHTIKSDGSKLLPNTVPEIAQFLKNNFKIFENTQLSTIQTQLTKQDKQPKKTSVVFEINPR